MAKDNNRNYLNMKKLVLILISLVSINYSYAQSDSSQIIQKPIYKLLSNGFYANLGLAFPTFGIVIANSSNFGFEPNLEIGNQWYFLRSESIGFGVKLSWIQAGFSSYSDKNVSPTPTSNFDFRLLKIAPQLSLIINSNFAIDAYFELSPTLMLGGNANSNPGYTYSIYGFLFAPGVRLRYSQLALGFDYGSGNLTYSLTQGNTTTNFLPSMMQVPRFYLGFQF